MLAGRLALEWGIVDVQAWLASLPRGALDFWAAFDQVEPIGERWAQSAMIAHQSAFGTYCQAGKEPPDFEDYMPPRWKRPKKRVEITLPSSSNENQKAFGGILKSLGLEKAKNGRNDQRS
jgi:hypothetical protein